MGASLSVEASLQGALLSAQDNVLGDQALLTALEAAAQDTPDLSKADASAPPSDEQDDDDDDADDAASALGAMTSRDTPASLFHELRDLAAWAQTHSPDVDTTAKETAVLMRRQVLALRILTHAILGATTATTERQAVLTQLIKQRSSDGMRLNAADLPRPASLCMSAFCSFAAQLVIRLNDTDPALVQTLVSLIQSYVASVPAVSLTDTVGVPEPAADALDSVCRFLAAQCERSQLDPATRSSSVTALMGVALARGSLLHMLQAATILCRDNTNALSLADVPIRDVLRSLTDMAVPPLVTVREVLAAGLNAVGELGVGAAGTTLTGLQHVHLPSNVKPVAVAAGNQLTVIATEDGCVFTCGLNTSGQCGLNSTRPNVPMPTLVQGLQGTTVAAVACAHTAEHMCAVDRHGQLYTAGYGDQGQLGHPMGNTSSLRLSAPRLVDGLASHKVAHVSASYVHTLVVTDKGAVFSFGYNECGQCGHGHTRTVRLPTQIMELADVRIVGASAGRYHSLFLSDQGAVYACGQNTASQLGLQTMTPATPQRLALEEPMQAVSAGANFSAALAVNGTVWTWGDNASGQLGHGNDNLKPAPRPTRVAGLTNITKLACGSFSTAAIDRAGALFTWGANPHGQLGYATPGSFSGVPTKVDLGDREAVDVGMGFHHMVVLANSTQPGDDEHLGSYSAAVKRLFPVGYWRLDGAKGTVTVPNDGTFSPALGHTQLTLPADVLCGAPSLLRAGLPGASAVFSGAPPAVLPAVPGFLPTGPLTITCWARVQEPLARTVVLSIESSAGVFEFGISADKRWTLTVGFSVARGPTAVADTTVFLAGVYVQGTLSFFVNGALYAAVHGTYAPEDVPQLAFGGSPSAAGRGLHHLTGSLSHVAIYAHALSPNVVMDLFREGSGLCCTYTVTGNKYQEQQWHECLTCGLAAGQGVCTACKERCHKGHNLSAPRVSFFYCDCGSRGRDKCPSLAPDVSSAAAADRHALTAAASESADSATDHLLDTWTDAANTSDAPALPNQLAGTLLLARLAKFATVYLPPPPAALQPAPGEAPPAQVPVLYAPLAVEVRQPSLLQLLQLLTQLADAFWHAQSDRAGTVYQHAACRLACVLQIVCAQFHQLVLSHMDPREVGLQESSDDAAHPSPLATTRLTLFKLAEAPAADALAAVIKAAASKCISSAFTVLYPTQVLQASFLAETLHREGAIAATEAALLAQHLPRLCQQSFWTALYDAVADDEVVLLPVVQRLLQTLFAVMLRTDATSDDAARTLNVLRVAQQTLLLMVAKQTVVTAAGPTPAAPVAPAPLVDPAGGVIESKSVDPDDESGAAAADAAADAAAAAAAANLLQFGPAALAWRLLAFFTQLVVDMAVDAIQHQPASTSVAQLLSQPVFSKLLRLLLPALHALPSVSGVGCDITTAMSKLLLAADELHAAHPSPALAELCTTVAVVLGRLAADVIAGGTVSELEATNSRWLVSTLLSGGLEAADDSTELGPARESAVYHNIIKAQKAGKTLMERLETLVPLSGIAARSLSSSKARRALRAVFAALLKHSAASYSPVDVTADTVPSPVASTYAAAIRHTAQILQTLHVQHGYSTKEAPDVLLERATFLLKLAPCVSAAGIGGDDTVPTRPSLFRGISALAGDSPTPLAPAPVDVVDRLRESMRQQLADAAGDSSDESIHTAVAAFLASNDSLSTLRTLIHARQRRAEQRAQGLALFHAWLQQLRGPAVRRHLLTCFAASWSTPTTAAPPPVAAAAGTGATTRSHFLANLEAATGTARARVRDAFFNIVSLLVSSCNPDTNPADAVLALNAVVVPYRADDYAFVVSSGLLPLLQRFIEWQASVQYVGEPLPSSFVHSHVEHVVQSLSASAASATDTAGWKVLPEVAWAARADSTSYDLSDAGRTVAASDNLSGRYGGCLRATTKVPDDGMYVELAIINAPRQLLLGLVPEGFDGWGSKPPAYLTVPTVLADHTYGMFVDRAAHQLVLYVDRAVARQCAIPVQLQAGPLYVCLFTRGGGLRATTLFYDSPPPVQALGTSQVAAVLSGRFRAPSTLFSMGQNSFGELLHGDTRSRSSPAAPPIRSPSDERYPVAVAAGNELSAVLLSDGSVLAAGMNARGTCATGTTDRVQLTPVLVKGIPAMTRVVSLFCSGGAEHMFAITSNWHLYGTGQNERGQLGLGHAQPVSVFTRVRGPLLHQRVVAAAVSFHHSLVVTLDGRVYAMGSNRQGQLGLGAATDVLEPVCLDTFSGVGPRGVAAGVHHSLVLSSSGKLWAMGYNESGQLGAEVDHTGCTTPILVQHVAGITPIAVACGYSHSVLLGGAGDLAVCGANAHGQLGLPGREPYRRFERLTALAGRHALAHISCGAYFTAAVTVDGKLLVWGDNSHDQLGRPRGHADSDDPFRPLPDFVAGQQVASIATGYYHTLAIAGPVKLIKRPQVPLSSLQQQQLHLRAACWAALRALLYNASSGPTHASAQDFSRIIVRTLLDGAHAVDAWWASTATMTPPLLRQTSSTGSVRSVMFNSVEDGGDETGFDSACVGWLRCNFTGHRMPAFRARHIYTTQVLWPLMAAAQHDTVLQYAVAQQPCLTQLFRMLFELGNLEGGAGTELLTEAAVLGALLRHVLPRAAVPDVTAAVLEALSPVFVWATAAPAEPNADAACMVLLTLAGLSVWDAGLLQNAPQVGAPVVWAVSCEVAAVVRVMASLEAWLPIVGRCLKRCLAADTLLRDCGMLAQSAASEADTGLELLAARRRVWALAGGLAVIGGDLEVLREGGQVAVVHGDLVGQSGVLSRYDTQGFDVRGTKYVAKARVSHTGESVYLASDATLKPLCAVPAPVELVLRTPRLLPQLLAVTSQDSQTLLGSGAPVAGLHWHLRARGMKALDALLQHAAVVQLMLHDGHISALLGLLCTMSATFASLPQHNLETYWVAAQKQRRKLVTGEVLAPAAPTAAAAGAAADAAATSWSCALCAGQNALAATACGLCGTARPPPAAAAASGATESKASTDVPSAAPALIAARSTDGWSLASDAGAETPVKSWLFDHTVPSVPGASLDIVGPHSWMDACIQDVTVGALVIPPGTYCAIMHGFGANGAGMYLNEYTLLMDVCLPTLADRDFTSLLQTDKDNAAFGDWYVKGDGTTGCAVYGGHVASGQWHRLAMVADLPRGKVTWFVDGVMAAEVRDGDGGLVVVSDDRWAIDTATFLFRDKQLSDCGEVHLAAFQVRAYAMAAADVAALGCSAPGGIPAPSRADLIARLMRETNLPHGWVVQALEATGNANPGAAREWLGTHMDFLAAQASRQAADLAALGFPQQAAAGAVAATGSALTALSMLLGAQTTPAAVSTGSDGSGPAIVCTESGQIVPAPGRSTGAGAEGGAADATFRHVGEFRTTWMCCQATAADAPGCTLNGVGRASGRLEPGTRVRRGPDWNWGSQDDRGFGTVVQMTSWSSQENVGVRIKWDNGHTNVYRWGHDGRYDVEAVAERVVTPAATAAGSAVRSGLLGAAPAGAATPSPADSPVYQVLNDTTQLNEAADGSGDAPAAASATLPLVATLVDEDRLARISLTVAQAMYVSYSRHTAVRLLEHSLRPAAEVALPAEASPSRGTGADASLNAAVLSLLTHDWVTGKDFLREFLVAFPDSLRSATLGTIMDARDPVVIVRAKLMALLAADVTRAQAGMSEADWQHSFTASLVGDVLRELLLLLTGSEMLLETGLIVRVADTFTHVGQLNAQMTVWKPVAPAGWVALGDVLVVGAGPPRQPVLLVNLKSRTSAGVPLVAAPARVESRAIIEAAAPVSLSILTAPPAGAAGQYHALGVIASMVDGRENNIADYGCIAAAALTPAFAQLALSGLLRGTPGQAYMWDVDNAGSTFLLTLASTPAPVGQNLRHVRPTIPVGSPVLLDWLLDVVISCNVGGKGLGALAPRVFSSPLIHALMERARTLQGPKQQAALRAFAAVLRHTGFDALSDATKSELARLKDQMQAMHAASNVSSGVFPSQLQAAVEVMVQANLAASSSPAAAGDVAAQAARDAVICRAAWFQQVVEVVGIMESLLDRAVPLPATFLCAEDTFQKLLLVDETRTLESTHPYSKQLISGQVVVPGATALTVRFDDRTEFDAGDMMCMYTDASMARPVLSYSGRVGGVTERVAGNALYYKFPAPRVLSWCFDTASCSKTMELSADRRTVSCTASKTWGTCRGTDAFRTGVHSWEVQINQTTAAGNVFVGVCTDRATMSSYLGRDRQGWGWIGCMALWHGGKKVRAPFGSRTQCGDVVRVTLDCNAHTLSYSKNGEEWGVAFTGLPADTGFYPAVSLFNLQDSLSLASGSDLLDAEQPKPVTSPKPAPSPAAAPAGDLALLDVEEEVPPRRKERAEMLSNMGYPIEWCIKALKESRDNLEVAAEYILTHDAELQTLSAELARRRAAREAAAKAEAESKFFADVAARTPTDSWTCPRCTMVNSVTSTVCAACEFNHGAATTAATGAPAAAAAAPVGSASGGADGSSAADASAPGDSGGDSSVAAPAAPVRRGATWGFRISIVPDLPPDALKDLSSRHAGRLSELQGENQRWTMEQDCALISYVEDLCIRKSLNALDLSPDLVCPTPQELLHYPALERHTHQQLQLRFLVLRNFNRRLVSVLPLVDLSQPDHESRLARCVRAVRGVILDSIKMQLWSRVLPLTHNGNAASLRTVRNPRAVINRFKATQWAATGSCDTAGKRTIFGQLFHQLHAQPAKNLRNEERAWFTEFAGEYADDYGGPYRDVVATVSTELMSGLLPLFVPVPNAREHDGQNQDRFVPHPDATTPLCLSMFEFVGKLMGIALRTNNPMELLLPAAVWKPLVGQTVLPSDIDAINGTSAKFLRYVADAEAEGVTEDQWPSIVERLNLRFTTVSTVGEVVDLIPGGKQLPVAWHARQQYVSLVRKYQVREFQQQCAAMYRGLATQVPRHLLGLFDWQQLELLACGRPVVDIALLKRCTVYADGLRESDAVVKYFWQVMEEWTDVERVMYLRFAWGRSRLPLNEAAFKRQHKLRLLDRSQPDKYLPIAHTCFFSVDLPRYSSKTVLQERLLYAATHCSSIDADDTSAARQAAAAMQWSGDD